MVAHRVTGVAEAAALLYTLELLEEQVAENTSTGRATSIGPTGSIDE
jgi:hypothetical protein